MASCKTPEILSRKAYFWRTLNGPGLGKRRRWPFFNSLPQGVRAVLSAPAVEMQADFKKADFKNGLALGKKLG
jgi:hypothetical protein